MTEIQDVTRHPQLLETLTLECPNSIRVIQSPHPIERYTCLMYVFEFTDKPEYASIASYGLGRVFAGADFAHWLIDRGVLTEIQQPNAAISDIAMYFSNGQFKHAGVLVDGGRVVSKWGIGHLYAHELLEVPESYGTEVRFFRRLPYEPAYDYFTRFAEEYGIPFENPDHS